MVTAFPPPRRICLSERGEEAARRPERRTHQRGMHGGCLRRTGIIVLWTLLYRGPSQAAFAAKFHIPAGTLREWEQSRKKPDTTALSFLKVIARQPEMVAKALEGA